MDGIVQRVDFPNKGIIYTEEGIVTVKNTFPDQKIRFMISKKRSGRAEGRLLEVLEPSPLESRPLVCDLFPDCGGCTWQTMPYEEQLRLKAGQVRRLLEPVLRNADGGAPVQAGGEPDACECKKELAGERVSTCECEKESVGGQVSASECEKESVGEQVSASKCEKESGIERMDTSVCDGKAADGSECADERVENASRYHENAGTSPWHIFEGIHSSPKEFAYRNKMEFSFGDAYKDGPLCLGLHKRGSHYDVLTASGCRLVHSDMTAILTATLSFFQERQIPYYHKITHEGILRHLLLRRSEKNGDMLVCLVTTGAWGEQGGMQDRETQDNREAEAFETVMQQYVECLMSLNLEGRIAGILHMRNDSVADVVQSECTTILYGQDCFYETLLGLRFKITPFSFFQTNSSGAEVLYSIARKYVQESGIGGTVFDLYSGTGTIAQILAPVAKKVIGVEIVEEAVEAARVNARMNDLDNCIFLAGDVLKVLDTIPERPDFIVLDPPRDGVHPKALQKIIAYGVPYILYISCKPTSLARDLEVLLASGYQPERLCCVDMFPQTANVETICLLHKPF